MTFASKFKTGIGITGGLLALSVALTGCAGSGDTKTPSTQGTYSSADATPIPQMILGVDPSTIKISDDIKSHFGDKSKSLASDALKFTAQTTGIPKFQDPTRVASPDDSKLLLPFKAMMTVDGYSNMTTQLAQGFLTLVPNTDTAHAVITVNGKKYTQQGKEFGFNYGDPTFSYTQGADGGGVSMTQEVKMTIPTTEGNVVTNTDSRQIIFQPTDDGHWQVATWHVTRVTTAS